MTLATDRRRVLAGLAALPAAAALPALADAPARPLGDIAVGAAEAPVTVIEYASFTCPHCAAFHRETWPELKARYIDTGKVRFILREVYFDPYGLWGSMLARCGGEAGYYPMVDMLLKRQSEWSRAEDVAAELQKLGRLNGLSSEQMRACLTDQAFAEQLVAAYQANAERDGIRSTPSFLINGTLHTGNMGIDEFGALIDALL